MNRRYLAKIPHGTRSSSRKRIVDKMGTDLNTYLTSILAIGMLVVAVAQWRVSEKQVEVSDALAQLEFAKSDAHFDIKRSSALLKLGPTADPSALAIPTTISVVPVAGVKSIFTMDGPVSMTIRNTKGDVVCDMEVRGLYTEENEGVLSLLDPAIADFRNFLLALRKNGLDADYGNTRVLIRYFDLFGKIRIKQFDGRLEINGPGANTAVLYSGAWSNGHGFYFDDGDLVRSCPEVATQLTKVVEETGGQAGKM